MVQERFLGDDYELILTASHNNKYPSLRVATVIMAKLFGQAAGAISVPVAKEMSVKLGGTNGSLSRGASAKEILSECARRAFSIHHLFAMRKLKTANNRTEGWPTELRDEDILVLKDVNSLDTTAPIKKKK